MRTYKTYEEMIDNQSINKQFLLPFDLSTQTAEVKRNFHNYLIGNKICLAYYLGKLEGVFYFQFPTEEFKKTFIGVLENHFKSLDVEVQYDRNNI